MISLWQTSRAVKLENIPDQQGKVCVVTGGTSGLGYETSKALAARNASAFLTYRDLDRYNLYVFKIVLNLRPAKSANLNRQHCLLAVLWRGSSLINPKQK